MIPMMMIRFIGYKILILRELFKFFDFEDLRSEFCGSLVAIGRCTRLFIKEISNS